MLTKSLIVVSIIVVALAIAVIGIHDSAYFVGRAAGVVAAKSDTYKGHYEMKFCDLGDCVGAYFTKDPVEQDYAKLLNQKFGIAYNNICDVEIQKSNSLTQGWYSGFAHGYFQVSYEEINHKFGAVPIIETHREAAQNYLLTHRVSDEESENIETSIRVDNMEIEEIKHKK